MRVQMQKAINARFAGGRTNELLDMNGWMARTTLEILGQAALGYSFDNFVEDSTDQYGESVKLFLYVRSLRHQRPYSTNLISGFGFEAPRSAASRSSASWSPIYPIICQMLLSGGSCRCSLPKTSVGSLRYQPPCGDVHRRSLRRRRPRFARVEMRCCRRWERARTS